MLLEASLLAWTGPSDTLTWRFTAIFAHLAPLHGDAKGQVIGETNMGTFKEEELSKNVPVPGAFEPVEDVGAAGVVDLVERVSVGLLDGHSVA